MDDLFRKRQVNEAIAANNVLRYETVQIDGKWISDALKVELEAWDLSSLSAPKPILINAPTGRGKSTFVLNDVARKVEAAQQSVLLLSNRSALELQQKYALTRKFDAPQFGAETLEEIHFFGNIIVLTYQSVLRYMDQLRKYPVGVVVFDEVHFFCSDSTFNAWTERIFTALLGQYWNCKRIYMSATPDDVKSLIAYEELNLYLQKKSNPAGLGYLQAIASDPSIREYYIPADYSYVRLHFFNRWDSLECLVKEECPLDKWLIFTGSKEKGRELQGVLGECASFVDASIRNQNYREFANLARREMYENRVLITTSVLDNGVNFNDNDLKHVVIDAVDPVQIKQMLGRKRIRNGECIDLYIKQKNRKELQASRNRALAQYSLLQEFSAFEEACIQNRWGTMTESQQHLFNLEEKALTVPGTGEVVKVPVFITNNYAKFQLARAMGRIDEIDDRFAREGDLAFAYEVCRWLGKTYMEEMKLDQTLWELKGPLVAGIAEEYLRKESMTKDDVQELEETLKETIRPIKNSDIGINNSASDRKRNINVIFKYFKLAYECSKSGATWKVIRTSTDAVATDE